MSATRQTEIMEQQREQITSGQTIISSDHSLIHSGAGFEFSAQFTLGSGASEEIGLTTSDDKFAHLKSLSIEVIGDSVDVQLFIDSTFTGGTVLTSYNHNHNSDMTADMVVVLNPTVTDDGNAVAPLRRILNDSTNQNRSASNVIQNPDQEYVLKDSGTKYIFRATNTGTASTRVSVSAFFYEESQGLSNMPNG